MIVQLICERTGERVPARFLEQPKKRVHIECLGVDIWVDQDEVEFPADAAEVPS